MPREDRRIHFDNDEVYKAIYALCFQKQLKQPPPGQIVNFIADEMMPSQVFLYLKNPQDQSEAKLEYSRDFLAAALMLFCRGCGIPLPKLASKSIMINEGQLVLRVQI
jgi:hypothetical protein